ncbi:helix-turn-helix domain-containing protein [Streptomyces sp. NPDC047928]|uniref:helix-turn-helix domain-containing protein n=1 Tax=unclassified Streptomyces TaxID=2593676 RepID=UPI0037243616
MADGESAPDPREARDPAGFVDRLQALKDWSGLTYRELSARADAMGDVLPRSTVANMLSRTTLPREELLSAFVRACGAGPAELEVWLRVRKDLAARPRHDLLSWAAAPGDPPRDPDGTRTGGEPPPDPDADPDPDPDADPGPDPDPDPGPDPGPGPGSGSGPGRAAPSAAPQGTDADPRDDRGRTAAPHAEPWDEPSPDPRDEPSPDPWGEPPPEPRDEPPPESRGRPRRDLRWAVRWGVVAGVCVATVVIAVITLVVYLGGGDEDSHRDEEVAAPVAGPVAIRAVHSGLCLNERPGQRSGQVYQVACADAVVPRYSLVALPGGLWRIRSDHPDFGPGCSGIPVEAAEADGAPLVDQECGGRGPREAFRFEAFDGDRARGHRIRAAYSELCLTVRDASREPWADVFQSACAPDGAGQVFRLDPAGR